ncbi:MAG: hypothetical protein SGPRY_014906 [Prymnesium sp.]
MAKGTKPLRFNPIAKPRIEQTSKPALRAPTPSYLRATTASSNRRDEGSLRKELAAGNPRNPPASESAHAVQPAVRTTRITRSSVSAKGVSCELRPRASGRDGKSSVGTSKREGGEQKEAGKKSVVQLSDTEASEAAPNGHAAFPAPPSEAGVGLTGSANTMDPLEVLANTASEKPEACEPSGPFSSTSAAPLLASLEQILTTSSLPPDPAAPSARFLPQPKPSEMLSMPPPPPPSERKPRISDIPPMLDMSDAGFQRVPFGGLEMTSNSQYFLSPRPASVFSPAPLCAAAPHPMALPLQAINHSHPGLAASPLITFTPTAPDRFKPPSSFLPDQCSPSPTVRSSRGRFNAEVEVRGDRRSSSKRKREVGISLQPNPIACTLSLLDEDPPPPPRPPSPSSKEEGKEKEEQEEQDQQPPSVGDID